MNTTGLNNRTILIDRGFMMNEEQCVIQTVSGVPPQKLQINECGFKKSLEGEQIIRFVELDKLPAMVIGGSEL